MIQFRLLNEAEVKSVLTMDDLIETMTGALGRFSSGQVEQPVRSIVSVHGDQAFFGCMPAFARGVEPSVGAAGSGTARTRDALGAKLVTVFLSNAERGLDSHQAVIALLSPESGALLALLDGRYITEARTAAVSAVSSRLLARKNASSLAVIGSGVQARSHVQALSRVHQLRSIAAWSPNAGRRKRFADDMAREGFAVKVVEHAGEAVVGTDLIVVATSSPTPVLENGWVKPGAHIMAVGACRPAQREIDPALTARSRLFVDSRAAALIESGDVVMGIQEGRFSADHVVAELGEVVNGAAGRRADHEVTIFKSLGLAVEDVTAADLAYRRAVDRGVGRELTL